MKTYKFLSALVLISLCACEKSEDDNEPQITSCFNVNQMRSGEADFSFEFTSCSENATSYLWSFGDGTTSTEPNPSHTYDEFGIYTVTLTASAGDQVDSYTVPVGYGYYRVKNFTFDILDVDDQSQLAFGCVFLEPSVSVRDNDLKVCPPGTVGSGCTEVFDPYELSSQASLRVLGTFACQDLVDPFGPTTNTEFEYIGTEGLNLDQQLEYEGLMFSSEYNGRIRTSIIFSFETE